MKKVSILEMVFNGSIEQIADWLRMEIVLENKTILDALKLNEFWSCSISFDENSIEIRGDEDFKILEIEDLKIIEL